LARPSGGATRSGLSELAREVTRKQLVVLEAGGKRFDWTVLLSDSLLAGQGSEQLEDVTLALDGISRRFRVTLQSVDTAQRQIHMMLEIETGPERYAVDFDVGFFSSPMLDNTGSPTTSGSRSCSPI
jgi:hypothetical protein